MWNRLPVWSRSWPLLLLLLTLPSSGGAEPHPCGVIAGRVLDASGTTLPLAQLELRELRRGMVADARGEFRLLHVPAGSYRLVTSYLGYRTDVRQVQTLACDTTYLQIVLQPDALALEELNVRAVARIEGLHEPALKRRSAEIQQELGLTLAETLQEEVGLGSRSMGPAPARPVLRGLSGNRLALFEDGASTGDLSASSSDHAVAIDPIAARSLEVLRGPESLMLGAGSVAGVVNVDRGLVASQQLDSRAIVSSLSGDTGKEGIGLALRVEEPVGRLDLVMDASLRETGDQRTPLGRLGNSGLSSLGLGGGLAFNDDHLRLGLAASHFQSDYGIPGGFVGGHPNGVDIGLESQHLSLELDQMLDLALLNRVGLHSRAARYYHAEYESSGLLGIEFGVLSLEQSLELGFRRHSVFEDGRLRVELKLRDFATGGLSHAPDTGELAVALAWLEHLIVGDWHGSVALRAEHSRITPDQERFSQVVGHIRERNFGGVGGAVSLDAPQVNLGSIRLQAGVELLQGWRAPSGEELFSGGPHLAAYSYEIGNPELDAERSLSVELPLEFTWQGGRLRLSAFLTEFDDFIFPSFTGKLSDRRADLYEYRTLGRDARFHGLEWSQQQRWGAWKQESRISLVTGELDDGSPLPEIPPLGFMFGLIRDVGPMQLGVDLVGADRQDRVYRAEDPLAIAEAETAGWLRADADLLWRFQAFGSYQQLHLQVENLLDHEYRQHLSRIRSVMPEGGRSVKLTWRGWW